MADNLPITGGVFVDGTIVATKQSPTDNSHIGQSTLIDGSGDKTKALTIKAPSTPAVATDTAIVIRIADGSDVAIGATTDVAVVGDNPGSVSAKLRGLAKIFALISFKAASTPAVDADTALVTRSSAIGDSADAAIVTGAVGSLSGKLRGLLTLLANITFKAASTPAADTDAALVVRSSVLGDTGDAANVTGTVGSISGKMRGLVQLLSGLITVGSSGFRQVASVQRPNDAIGYTAGDAINATTVIGTTTFLQFVIGRIANGTGDILKARIVTDNIACTAQLRLHLFSANTPTKVIDNAAYTNLYAEDAAYLGYIDFPPMVAGVAANSSSFAQDPTLGFNFVSDAASTVYGLLQTMTAGSNVAQQNYRVTLSGYAN